jgi:hypothetical protein
MRALLTSVLLVVSCSGAQTPDEPRAAPRPLDEARAIELVAEVLLEIGVTGEAHRPVRLANVDFQLDVAVVGKPVGLELLTDANRQTLSAALGHRRAAGQLRVVAADEPGGGRVDVLILDDQDYRYDPDPIEHEGGAPTIQEVEGRFRRDLRDFFQHERTAGHL